MLFSSGFFLMYTFLEQTRRKYELQQFLNPNSQIAPGTSCNLSLGSHSNGSGSKQYEKQHTGLRHGLGQAFRNSWRRKESEQKAAKKTVWLT